MWHNHQPHISDPPSDDRPTRLPEWLGFVLLLVWVIWGGQVNVPVPETKPGEYEHQIKTEWQMHSFCQGFIPRAERLGRNYTPKEYFADLRRLDAEDIRLGFPRIHGGMKVGDRVSGYTREALLRDMSQYISPMGRGRIQEHAVESAAYTAWKRVHCPDPTDDNPLGDAIVRLWRGLSFKGFLGWLWIFHLRSMFLFLLLALYRAHRRDGIRRTISMNWKKFVWAVLLWPVGLFVYPYNVVREVRVEAELRRSGLIRRRLSVAEQVTVISVAASNGYREWLSARSVLPGRHSLVLALLVTVLLHLFGLFSFQRSASADTGSATCLTGVHTTVMTVATRAGPLLCIMPTSRSDAGGGEVAAVLPSQLHSEPPVLLTAIWHRTPVKQIRRREPIDHVPWLLATQPHVV